MTDTNLTLQADAAAEVGTLVVPVGSATTSTHPCEDAALRTAGWLARLREARVVLVRVAAVPEDWHLWEPHASKAAVASRDERERTEHRLVAAAQALYYRGLPVEVEVVRRVDVPAGIAEAARDVEADLVVMGAPCLRGLVRPSPACRAARVVAQRACNVLAVYRAAKPSASTAALRRIVLLVPARADAPFGSRLAISLAAHHGAALDVVVVRADAERSRDPEGVLEGLRARHSNGHTIDRLGGRAVRATVTEADGLPEALRSATERTPDLVVVAGSCGFDTLVEAGAADCAAVGGDWVFAFPANASEASA